MKTNIDKFKQVAEKDKDKVKFKHGKGLPGFNDNKKDNKK